MNHENIIKCHNIYEDNLSIHFVFDLVKGGDLYGYLMTSEGFRLPENRAQEFFAQILDALQYLHMNGIVHRDIKPENFLIDITESKVTLKLIDFGFAVKTTEGQRLKEPVGSPQYMAPEIVEIVETGNGSYDHKVDIWAAGVVLYNMITGRQPFAGQAQGILIKNIMTHEVNFNPTFFKNPALKDLCSRLLTKDPNKRPDASLAKLNPWVVSTEMQQTVFKPFAPSSEMVKNIILFMSEQSNLKHEVWTLLLTYLVDTEIERIKALIELHISTKEYDDSLQSKTHITYEKLIETVLSLETIHPDLRTKLTGMFLNNLLELNEKNRSLSQIQVVNFVELLNSLRKCKDLLKKEKIWNLFKNQDKTGCGYLTYEQTLRTFQQNIKDVNFYLILLVR
jgi:serine/threonine protein kinase